MPAAVDAEGAGPMKREGFRSGWQGERVFRTVQPSPVRRGAGRFRFHAGNCPAFYWLLMCIFENIPL